MLFPVFLGQQDNMKISVIICSYNREKYIRAALESMVAQDFPAYDFEVLVVDNNSSDNTGQVCRAFISAHPGFHLYYFLEKRQGASYARNTGAEIAKGELLCFMDDDAVAEPDFLKKMADFHRNNPGVNAFGGRIIPRYIPEEPRWMSHFVSSLVGNFHYADTVTEFAAKKYPLESNMVVTKKVFQEVGGFNTALPGVKGELRIGGEGKDLFFRIREKGNKIFYVPGMIVHHVVETQKLDRNYMYRVASGIGRGERQRIGKGPVKFWMKFFEYLFKLAASVLIGLFYVSKGQPAKFQPVVNFRIDVLKGFLGR